MDDQLAKVNRRLQRSVALGHESHIRGELTDVFMECSQANWDGFNALPVSLESFQLAQRFLLALPLGTAAPSIGAVPDGQITMEWYAGPRRSLTICFDPAGHLHFAALAGPSRCCGTELLGDSVPETILKLIQRVS